MDGSTRSGSSSVMEGVGPSSSVIFDGESAASWVVLLSAVAAAVAVAVEGRRVLCIVKAWDVGANNVKSEMMKEENFILDNFNVGSEGFCLFICLFADECLSFFLCCTAV